MSSDEQQSCPKCESPYCYQDRNLWICPECSYEWTESEAQEQLNASKILDFNGAELFDGDTVTVIKDLKVKGASNPIKVGTKIKNIKLNPDSSDGHNINCRVDGFGQMGLKSEFVKKV